MIPTIVITVILTAFVYHLWALRQDVRALDATNAWCDAKDEFEEYLEENDGYDLLVHTDKYAALRKRVSQTYVTYLETHRYFANTKSTILADLHTLEPEDQDRALNLLFS